MGQNFIPDTVNQTLLFPPSLHDWLPDGHLARFVVDVVSALDLDSIYASYREKDGRGQSAYAPEMMVRLLLYGYATGVYSSRKIERRTWEDVAFRYLSGDQHPDHATLSEFRKRHLTALAGLFTQALLLCAKAGLAQLGHVSIDGTKIKANASKHKAMSYKRMTETEARLKQEINALLAAAEKADSAEVTQETNDKKQLLPMITQIEKNLAEKPEKVSADAGYFSEANVTDAAVAKIDLYVATGRDKHGDAVEITSGDAPAGATAREQMQHKLKTESGRADYKMRKAIVEPVFGQIKECRGFRRFSMRGKQNVRGEWRLVCAVSNLLKLSRFGWMLQPA